MNPRVDDTAGLNSSQPISNGPVNDSAQIFSHQGQYQVGRNLPTNIGAASPNPQQLPAVGLNISDQSGAAASADDLSADALDEQWVNKAKAIVEQTKADPYVESRELNKAKADYLRIRYNKQIKVSEDPQK